MTRMLAVLVLVATIAVSTAVPTAQIQKDALRAKLQADPTVKALLHAAAASDRKVALEQRWHAWEVIDYS